MIAVALPSLEYRESGLGYTIASCFHQGLRCPWVKPSWRDGVENVVRRCGPSSSNIGPGSWLRGARTIAHRGLDFGVVMLGERATAVRDRKALWRAHERAAEALELVRGVHAAFT